MILGSLGTIVIFEAASAHPITEATEARTYVHSPSYNHANKA